MVCALVFSLSAEELDFRIPVVDLKDYHNLETRGAFLDTLYNAMREVGFFAVRNTGVDVAVVSNAYKEAEEFFRQDLDEKLTCFSPVMNGQRGFVGGETAKGNARKDRKEFYHIGREGDFPANIWPEKEAFKTSLTTLYNELDRHVVPLQQAIIETINRNAGTNLSLNLLNSKTERGPTLLRALYYPAMTKQEMSGEPIYWAAAHTDIDCLAILPYGTEKGLQVEYKGEWLNVVVPSDAFVVNVGDMLENLTNGLFTSAKHRVFAQEPGKDRFSMVLFVHFRSDEAIDPLPACVDLTGGIVTYAPGTAKEFLWERLIELNLAPALLEPYSQTGHTERQLQYGRQSPQVVDLLIKNNLASEEVRRSM